MNKVILIIRREYLTRVRKKSFLVMTFVVPLVFIGMFAALGFLMAKQNDLGEKKKVEVVDETGLFHDRIKNRATIDYTFVPDNYAAAKANFTKSGYDYLLYIPSSLSNFQLFSEKKASAAVIQNLESSLNEAVQSHRLQVAGIDTAVLAKAQKPVSIDARQITETGEKDAQTYAAYGVGLLSAILIYMSLFLYGTQVMRGVIEEKVSRIIEVIISSVKPFQLMLGKIIGVGLVGMTQFILWIALTITLSTVAGGALMKKSGPANSHARFEQAATANNAATVNATTDSDMASIMKSIESIPVVYIVLCFLFYYFFGYMLYSSIFAAIGSAVDSETETQQFMLPITMPIIFTFYLSMSVCINNPDSPLSIWLSMIPFTSPMAMMIRIPFGVPAWQLAASMILMILGFLATTWIAARIYRVGILMYGKKASYKELAKWIMYKG